jgi:hypothetical protein
MNLNGEKYQIYLNYLALCYNKVIKVYKWLNGSNGMN